MRTVPFSYKFRKALKREGTENLCRCCGRIRGRKLSIVDGLRKDCDSSRLFNGRFLSGSLSL